MSVPRRMWALFEPIHAVTYFAPQPQAAFAAVGLRGFWRGYFAGRAAPLGAVGPDPVIASFFGFAPRMVTRALPDVWTRASPEATLAARATGAREALRDLFSGAEDRELGEAAEVLRAAASMVDVAGRVLGAANAGLPWPEGDPVDVLWHAATILREHRGDGHVAALLTAGLDGCESLVWRASLASGDGTPSGEGTVSGDGTPSGDGAGGVGRGWLQPARGWTDEEWEAAAERLAGRGWLTSDGAATDRAREAYDEIEAVTDRLADGPWRRLGAEATQRCARLLTPLATKASACLPNPNPIGVPSLVA